MNHEKFKEWIILSLYNELDTEKTSELNEHLKKCEKCKEEFTKLKKLHDFLEETVTLEYDEQLLFESRKNLRVALMKERMKISVWQKLKDFVDEHITLKYRIAMSGISLTVLGIFMGYFFFSARSNDKSIQAFITPEGSAFIQENTQIVNLRFIDHDATDGNIELTFEEITPVKMKGNINDPKVQKVLAYALINEQNPGVRLKTVNALASRQSNMPDKGMKEALIKSLKNDENPGVRKEALKVLSNMLFDNEIKDAFLYVLSNDKNSSLRITAINCLGRAKDIEKSIDARTANVLRDKIQTDENDYIRSRAKAILSNIKQ